LTAEGLIKRAIAAVCAAAAAAAVAVFPTAAGASPLEGTRGVTAPTDGYWVVNSTGAVGAAGGAPVLGSLRQHQRLDRSVVGMAATPDGQGYWLATAGGGVFSFGDARFFGSASSLRMLHASAGRVVGIAAAPGGHGYWLAAANGEVYSYGSARYLGVADLRGRGYVVGIAASPHGMGYWLATSKGEVYSFGTARYHGGAARAGRHVVSITATPQGGGYWLTSAGGAVMPFGDAADRGAAAPSTRSAPIVGMAALLDGRGYWVANRQGTAYGYGAGSRTAAARLAAQAVAIVADPAPVAPGRPVRASGGAQLRQEAATVGAPDQAGEAAVAFALAQVGKPYSYGATGPYAFDCSGLALSAWRAAGVELPRTAAQQYNAGVHVPLSDLQPGDLVFWATDPSNPATIYHVAISLGGDRTVQATQPGGGVQEMGLWGAGLLPLATRPA
jgi:cell wall-associated NlpC family hydrolase